ncbi:hypothetical protein JHK82_016062 [Glycine max]|nr:hypothetical protein JHK86_016090 [Glycine max]KAG5149181.1 hypothetical protein JHK82_016062 [Glycine max]
MDTFALDDTIYFREKQIIKVNKEPFLGQNWVLKNDDLSKLLKKFPEVLGCNLEEELKGNVKILEEQSYIKGNSLRKLLLRNPKVLGYNVDCKGDYIAQCTRC